MFANTFQRADARNPQVHPRLRLPASSTSGCGLEHPSLFLCFEQVCTYLKCVWYFLALGVGVPANEAGSQEISHRFWGNPSPTFGKCVTDFGKCVTDFGEIRHRF